MEWVLFLYKYKYAITIIFFSFTLGLYFKFLPSKLVVFTYFTDCSNNFKHMQGFL